jgi:hypothetical protein
LIDATTARDLEENPSEWLEAWGSLPEPEQRFPELF